MVDRGGGDQDPRPPARVIRLHSIRTLVIARVLAFRQRAMTVLAELGPASFAIAALDAREEVLALVGRERPDVVVLDATAYEQSIATVVQMLCDHSPRLGVVIVATNGGDHRELGLPALPKWGWAADLVGGVQEAYRNGNPLKENPTRHVN